MTPSAAGERVETVTAMDVAPAELEVVERLVADLPSDSPLAMALGAMVRSVRRGSDVVVASEAEQLTPTQAAKLLRMSRTHLYKILDAGELPFVRVGRDRRIAIDDLYVFRARREQDRRRLAESFAHVAETRRAALAEVAGGAVAARDPL